MMKLKVSGIGNSKGVVEKSVGSITLCPERSKKLSWACTALEMVREEELWSDFNTALADGFDDL